MNNTNENIQIQSFLDIVDIIDSASETVKVQYQVYCLDGVTLISNKDSDTIIADGCEIEFSYNSVLGEYDIDIREDEIGLDKILEKLEIYCK